MEKTKLTMGQKLKMFREIENLSQEELGQKLNVSDKTISAWENEERDISLPNATLIAEFFNIPKEYFVFDENKNKISSETKNKIKRYLSDYEFANKIKTIISCCKEKLENDGLPYKKEYIPSFNFDNKNFETFGVFDEKSLPVKIEHHKGLSALDSYHRVNFTNSNLTDLKQYQYSSAALTKFGLFDILKRFNENKVELIDLIDCNNLNIFKNTLSSMKERKYTQKNIYNPYSEGRDISQEYIQNQLNELLEKLNPNLSNFWAIVVFLIENGAYFTKQVGWGDDIVSWSSAKDIARTNYIYRIAKDNISK